MQGQKIHKVILLGDTSTGKSSFLKNYISNSRPRVLKPTEGFECLTAVSTNPTRWLQLWDTPGQEKYRMMPQAIINSFDYAIVFYDITSKHTFKVAEQISKSISMYHPGIQILILGNKLDIVLNNPSKREVSEQQGARMAKKVGGNFIQYSFEERADNLISRLFTNKWAAIEVQDEKPIRLDRVQEQAQCRTCM